MLYWRGRIISAVERFEKPDRFPVNKILDYNKPGLTLGLEVTIKQLAAITGKKPALVKKQDGGVKEMNAKSIYTREIMSEYIAKGGFEIGEFTYGTPVIRWWGEDAKLKIGRFCSIAANVKIYLGGNHRPECITSYPFPSPPMNKDWPNAR